MISLFAFHTHSHNKVDKSCRRTFLSRYLQLFSYMFNVQHVIITRIKVRFYNILCFSHIIMCVRKKTHKLRYRKYRQTSKIDLSHMLSDCSDDNLCEWIGRRCSLNSCYTVYSSHTFRLIHKSTTHRDLHTLDVLVARVCLIGIISSYTLYYHSHLI